MAPRQTRHRVRWGREGERLEKKRWAEKNETTMKEIKMQGGKREKGKKKQGAMSSTIQHREKKRKRVIQEEKREE